MKHKLDRRQLRRVRKVTGQCSRRIKGLHHYGRRRWRCRCGCERK